MGRFRLRLPLFNSLEVIYPKFKSSEPFLQKLAKGIFFYSQFLLLIFIFLQPFSLLFIEEYNGKVIPYESSIFFVILIGLTLFAGLYLILLSLLGKKVLRDPTGFTVTLIFALLTTTASIFADPPSEANTFGGDYFRGISGLFVMAGLFLFYLVSVYTIDKNFLKRILDFLAWGMISYLLYLFAFNPASEYFYAILLFGLPFFLYKVLSSKNARLIYGFAFLAAIIKLMNVDFSLFDPIVFVTGYMSSSIIFVVLYIFKKKLWKVENLKVIFTGRNVTAILAVIILTIGFFTYLVIDQGQLDEAWNGSVDQIERAYQVISTERQDQWRFLTFGLGAANGEEIVMTNSASLLSNVLVTQGMFGILAYIILFGFGFYLSLKLAGQLIVKGKLSIIFPLFLLVFSVPVICFFIYGGIVSLIFWWIAFALLSSYKKFLDVGGEVAYTDHNWEILDVKWFRKDLKVYPRVVSLVVGIALTSFFILSLINVIGEV